MHWSQSALCYNGREWKVIGDSSDPEAMQYCIGFGKLLWIAFATKAIEFHIDFTAS